MHGTMRLYPLELVRHFHTEFFNVKSELNFVFQLSILEGTEIIYLAKAQLGETVKIATFPGMRMPAHCTAMGKVFLSQYGKDSLLCMYPNRKLEKITPSTVANVEDLWLQLCEFKKSGFIIEVGETKTGYSCVAAAVRNAFGRITAAVSMTTLTPYPSREHEEASVVIREFCDHISAKLGYASGKDDPV
jgi:IclR family KDG regulon transcriptional repressor